MDRFSEVIVGVIIGVVTAVIATALTFYLRDYLKEKAKFKKFKEKLEQIAGKNATIIIPDIGQVEITEINKQGITVKNELCTTFIPMEKCFEPILLCPLRTTKNY
ncbi:MAG: hypothetical protein ABSF24_12335 [Candidatus Bathyarchaeia archaeon]